MIFIIIFIYFTRIASKLIIFKVQLTERWPLIWVYGHIFYKNYQLAYYIQVSSTQRWALSLLKAVLCYTRRDNFDKLRSIAHSAFNWLIREYKCNLHRPLLGVKWCPGVVLIDIDLADGHDLWPHRMTYAIVLMLLTELLCYTNGEIWSVHLVLGY